ncbi:MAG: glutamine--fructose-6-phosphate transaminase (isomerizing), partial [Prevotella sp.]|nr:glutamine--fructose-6-phosphate transaminase (isomerizing) [Prevotella sp.]
FCNDKNVSGTVGIAHTRWATHGEPSSLNAHPHYSMSKNLAIIHNGIIENYAELKGKLSLKGIRFVSDTDTEVLVQLIEYIRNQKNTDLLTAVQLALHEVIGAYAIAILDRNEPNQIIAARKQSPLVVGIGDDEFFIGSDASPIIEYTDKVVYLEDGNIAVIQRDKSLEVVNIYNRKINPEIQTVDINLGQIEKGGYPHFMLKEIFEQPECITNCMRGRVNVDIDNVVLSAVIDYKKQLLNAKRFVIVACGTSWHAGLIGKQIIESLCRIPVEVEYASEFRYRNPVITKDDVVIAISQSGETADTLAAVKLAREHGAFIYGICNAIGSSIPRATHTGSYIHVGPEIGVASTKAFTGQVTVLSMLALAMAKELGTISPEDYKNIVTELNDIPAKMKEVLKLNNRIADLSRSFTYARDFLFLGRGYSYPVALEGALKLKEISYIHAEGYPAAEMKHGPIALIDSDMPVVVIATHNAMYEKVLSNIQEVKARQGKVIAIVTKGDDTISRIADEVIEMPQTIECLEPLLSTIPLQMLAYHIAVCKGKNVDQPRNLAKSVTVE